MTRRKRSRSPGRSAARIWLRRLLVGGLVLGLFLLVVGTVAAWFAWRHFSADLPDISAVDDHRPAQTTTVLAADGSLLARWTDDRLIHRTVVPWEEIPQVMRDAMLAAEDADFYSHPGLDYRGLVRAAIRNIEAGATVQGASTITQQLVKNLVLSPERTYRRKIQELLLAFRLEERLSKDEILELYLNEVFFGRTAYGVEEAAHYYFGRGIATVSLPEAALLAAVVQSPNRLDPHRHPERALARRAYVLRQMWEKGFIEESVYRAADEAPIVLAGPEDRPPRLDRHPWVVDAARRELLVLAEEVPELAGRNWMAEGLRIHTTVDPELQDAAEAAVVAGLQAFDERRGFLRPFRMLDAEGAERWGREQHADVMRAGLDADEAYRAVIVRSDSEATVVRMGGVDATLVRAPESRMRPDASREWAEVLPVHAVFTVQPVRSWTPDALASASPEDLLVRFRPSAQAALIAMDVDERAIRAIVGGFDFRESSFHRAVQARRQTGSAFKTFVFAAGLDARLFSPATLYVDQPFTQAMDVGPDWRPRNHDGRYEGEMSARRALARSRNTVTAQILRQVGVDAAQRMAREAGIAVQLPEGLALALGAAEMSPMELTTAYATLAAGGVHAQPGIISRIEDSEGNVLFQREVIREQRIAPDTAWLTTSMLRSVVTEGTGSQARRLPFETAGKTGTTNQVRDAWYVGYSTRLVTGVWVGRDSFDPLGRGEGGGRTALPIWVDFMAAAHADDPPPGFPEPPPGVRVVRVDEATGLRARAGASGARDEFFLEGTVPLDMAPVDEERSVEDTLLRGSIFGFDEDQEDGSGAEGAPSHGF